MIPRVVFNLHCNGFGNQTCGQIDNTVNNKVDKFVADEPLSVSGHDQSVLLGGTTHSNKASAVTKRPRTALRIQFSRWTEEGAADRLGLLLSETDLESWGAEGKPAWSVPGKTPGCRRLPESAWGWCFGYPKLPEPSVGGGEMVGSWRGERTRERNPSTTGESAGNAKAQSPWEHTAGAAVCLGDRRWKKLRVSAI